MYKLATFEDFETVALARRGVATSPEDIMGYVPYGLANLTEDRLLGEIGVKEPDLAVAVTLVLIVWASQPGRAVITVGVLTMS